MLDIVISLWYNATMNDRELQAIDKFAKMPLSRLRHYQRLNEAQIQLAYRLKKTAVLERLQRMSTILATAVDKK